MFLSSILIVLISLHSVYADCNVYYEEITYTCSLICEDVGWNDNTHPGNLAGEIATQLPVLCSNSDFNLLMFFNCSFPNQNLDGDWFTQEDTPKFEFLEFYEVELKSIGDGAIAKYNAFNNSLKNFNILFARQLTAITHGVLQDISHPEEFNMIWTNEILLLAQTEVFTEIAPQLKVLEIGNASTPKVVANITGKCQPAQIKNLKELVYTTNYEAFIIFSKDLISAMNSTKLEIARFELANIAYFEDNSALEPLATQPSSLKVLSFENNRLTTIPDGLFEPLVNLNRNITVQLAYNLWHCDGNLQYLQDIMKNTSHQLQFNSQVVICMTPASQAGKLVIDADLSGEFKINPPVPRLEITCA